MTYRLSLQFHRDITPVPFTPVCSRGKQVTMGVIGQYTYGSEDMRLDACQGPNVRVIAIIDDDDCMQDSLRDLIESAGHEVRCFGSAREFLESGLHRQVACLITDILMAKMSGLELLARLRDEGCNIPIIFITAYDDTETRIQAMREGAVEFLTKPVDHQVLFKTLQAALDM